MSKFLRLREKYSIDFFEHLYVEIEHLLLPNLIYMQFRLLKHKILPERSSFSSILIVVLYSWSWSFIVYWMIRHASH